MAVGIFVGAGVARHPTERVFVVAILLRALGVRIAPHVVAIGIFVDAGVARHPTERVFVVAVFGRIRWVRIALNSVTIAIFVGAFAATFPVERVLIIAVRSGKRIIEVVTIDKNSVAIRIRAPFVSGCPAATSIAVAGTHPPA
jgi:hypothetical protein